MFIPISEQVFVPVHRIEKISFFSTTATIKYNDDRQVDIIDGEDAARLRRFLETHCKVAVGG